MDDARTTLQEELKDAMLETDFGSLSIKVDVAMTEVKG
jgi:hypothetical protein